MCTDQGTAADMDRLVSKDCSCCEYGVADRVRWAALFFYFIFCIPLCNNNTDTSHCDSAVCSIRHWWLDIIYSFVLSFGPPFIPCYSANLIAFALFTLPPFALRLSFFWMLDQGTPSLCLIPSVKTCTDETQREEREQRLRKQGRAAM